mgnify:CR=1 FL=1
MPDKPVTPKLTAPRLIERLRETVGRIVSSPATRRVGGLLDQQIKNSTFTVKGALVLELMDILEEIANDDL